MHELRSLILLVWIAFWTYWIILAFSSKRNSRSFPRGFFGFRIVLIIIVLTLIRTDNFHSDFWTRVLGSNALITHNLGLGILGTALIAAGLSFAIWARLNIGKNWGTPMTEKKDPELVTSGPYHYVRHPIYSGILLAGLGTAIAVGLFWLLPFIIYGAYFIFSAHREEQYLNKQFGDTYKKYKASTKMLIPFIF